MSEVFNSHDHPHRRFNPLLNEWVLVSPHRAKRPWMGESEAPYVEQKPGHDAKCYLCSGNQRITGEINPNYKKPFVFTNDFAALQPNTPEYTNADPLFKMEAEQGEARVICFSADHSASLPELEIEQIREIVDCWIQQSKELGKTYCSVQLFENKGATMGCSIPHPHGQVWAQKHLPTIVTKEQAAQIEYFKEHKSNLLLDYAKREVQEQLRLVVQNEHWIVVVPFWAGWPFETLVLPLFSVARITDLISSQKKSLADIIQKITIRYDNLFNTPFPYSMGWHGAPFNNKNYSEWQLHAHFYPPLLRSATVRKFMVGYEMMAESQRDITPEQAAKQLRECSDIHYKKIMKNE